MNRLPNLFAGALLLLPLALAACDGLTPPGLDSVAGEPAAVRAVLPAPAPIVLEVGDSARLRGARLAFDSAGPDSRCLYGAYCPKAGHVTASLTLHAADGTAYPFSVTLPGGAPGQRPLDDAPWAVAGGYAVHLLRVQPYPGYPPDAGMPTTATVVAEPCGDRCYEIYPPPTDS